MTTSSQDRFEQSYSEFTGHPVAFIHAQRLSNDSYGVPRIATAYTWWKRSRAEVVVELPVPETPESFGVTQEEDPEEYAALERRAGAQYSAIHKCQRAIEAHGLAVAS